MSVLHTIACLALLPSCLAAPVVVDVSVDATTTGVPLVHKWKRSFGSGHAQLTLREDWRNQASQAADELGMAGVRFHGMFDDDMGPVVTAPGVYNFSLIDSTWDFLKATGIKPIVELSFMPAVLANCSWHGHCVKNPVGCQGYDCWRGDCKTVGGTPGFPPIVNPDAPACRAREFHYQGIRQVPAVMNDWYELVHATVSHAVDRYGLPEVQTWTFEVWNEMWGVDFPGTAEHPGYMQLYNASAKAVKDVHSSLKVGGPATAGLDELSSFVEACKTLKLPEPDFVSSHHYPSDGRNGPTPMQQACPTKQDWDPSCWHKQVKAAAASVAPLPFLLTEYNVGCCLGYSQHDTAAAAAFIFKAVGELNDFVDLYSYWTFSDVFEEGGLPEVEFLGVYGSMTISGIPKPVWTAFQLLHTHAGNQRLPTEVTQGNISYISAMATTNDLEIANTNSSSLRVFLGFWGNPDTCCNATARSIRLTVNHNTATMPLPSKAVLHVIDDTHGNVQSLWHSLGAPNKPNAAQLAQLKAASAAGLISATVGVLNATATVINVPMTENSAVVVEYL